MRCSILLVLSAVTVAGATETDYEAVLDKAAALSHARDFDGAADLLTKTLAQAESENQETWIPHILNDLGTVYAGKGQYRDAELSYRKAVDICSKPDAATTAPLPSALSNLGSLYYEAGQFTTAQRYLVRAETILKGFPATSALAIVENNLGAVYLGQHKDEVAMRHASDGLEIWTKVQGADGEGAAFSFTVLGSAYQHMGVWDKALENLEQALAIWKKKLGPKDIHTAKAMANLGIYYVESGDLPRAVPFFESARAVFEDNHLSDLFVIQFLRVYADLDHKLGLKKEAKELTAETRKLESASAASIIAPGLVEASAFTNQKH